MIKKALVFAFAFVFLIQIEPGVIAAERIVDYETNAIINDTGVINIRETIDYDFGNTQRHGILRNIPFVKTNEEGKKFAMEISNISVTDGNGNDRMFALSKENGEIQLKIGDPNKTITGINTYVITYEVSGAITYFEEHDELYWNVIGAEWDVPILNASGLVQLPESVEIADAAAICFTGSEESNDQNCQIDVGEEYNYYLFEAQSLKAYEGLTVAVSFPKGHVAQLEPEPYGLPQPIKYLLYVLVGIAAIMWYLCLPGYFTYKWFKERQKIKNNQRIVAAWFDPPKDDVGREYTPIETATLVEKTIDNKKITATLIYLAQQGYMKIHLEKRSWPFSDDIVFEQLKSADENLNDSERDFYETIFSLTSDDKVDINVLKKSSRFSKGIKELKKDVGKNLVDDGLITKDFDRKSVDTLLTFLGLYTLNIILLIVVWVLRSKTLGFTDKGIEKYSVARSLENFLKSQDSQFDFQAEKQMYFEKLLPYATAFGVEDVWIKRFGSEMFESVDWLEGDVASAAAFTSMSNSMSTTVKTHGGASSSSGFSSGFSGGSSGGGGGGGGGGSW